MTNRRHTMGLAFLAGGLLTALGLVFGPAGEASAAQVDIHLDAGAGTTTLPTGGTSVKVWGYCRRPDAATACPAPTAPGGPVLTVTEGDTVTVTLHNALTEATALTVGGQTMVPDVTGAPAGGTKSYSFTAGRPGTYLYEAGLTPNSQHQVAMGLYGALVVRPAGAPLQAYGDTRTGFDTEQVMLLSEIDPALNNAANPAAFDMRNYAARYFLINGKTHPNTAPIPASSGQKVLLRYVNAGVGYHSMAVLGADQRVVGLGGSQLENGGVDTSRRYVAETFGPGQTADAIVTVPATVGDRTLAVYDAALGLRNGNTAGAGGMLAFLQVTGTGTAPAADTAGPATRSVALAGSLTATVADTATGGGVVAGAEYYVDAIGGTATAMTAGDGAFDSPSETVTAGGLPGVSSGQHIVYVRGKDAAGNWGPFSSVLVTGSDATGPATSGLTLTPGRTNAAAGSSVTISATADDTASGGSAIKAAQWSFASGASTGTALTVSNSGSIASLDATISQTQLATLAEGARTVYVRSQDSADNWGDWVSAELVVDKTAPTAAGPAVTPNPSNGTVSVNSGVSAVRLSAALTDQPGAGVTSPIARGEAFVDTLGAVGTGIPLEAADGAFNAATENVYTDIPLATVRVMTQGNHTLYVRGRDAAGNWGPAATTVLVVDRAGPAVTATVSPSPTNGAATVTLSGTVTDALTAVASAEWFIGTDPGVGQGTSLTPNASGAFSATVNVSGLGEGTATVTVRARDTLGNTTLVAKPLVVTHPLWFSTTGGVNPPGVTGTANNADVYNWNGATYSRTMDLSAAPYRVPNNANVDGFSRVDATHFYISFNRSITRAQRLASASTTRTSCTGTTPPGGVLRRQRPRRDGKRRRDERQGRGPLLLALDQQHGTSGR